MNLGFALAAVVLLAAAPPDETGSDFPLDLPTRPDWWRREVPRGRPMEAGLRRSLENALDTLPAQDWGRALADAGRVSLWDLGGDAEGLRHLGFRGHRRFTRGTDPGEWEGLLVLNPDIPRVLTIEAWPVNQAELSAHRLQGYRRSTRLTLDLGFLLPFGRVKPPPKVHDLRLEFLEDGRVLEQRRSAKLKSSSGPTGERTHITVSGTAGRSPV